MTAAAPNQSVSAAPLRVVFWGTYDLGKPRARILRDGLRETGAEVVEINAPVWPSDTDKSQMGSGSKLRVAFRAIAAYPKLIWRYLRTPPHDAVVVPYLGQFDVLVLWPFALLRRRPILWDMFISLYDTVVNDRKMVRPRAPAALVLWAIEWLACKAASRVLMDTRTHASYIARLFGVVADRVAAVPLGAEPGAFPRQQATLPHDGPVRILFYGQLIPLHGIATILAAAKSERGRKHHWRIIGTGQEHGLVADALADGTSPHIVWNEWEPYDELVEAIAEADICLGIFGGSDKAASVVPNKVYQALMAGRSVITRRSPAMDEMFPDPDPGLQFVTHGDPDALLDAVDALQAGGFPVMPEQKVAVADPRAVGQALRQTVQALIGQDDGAAGRA